MNFFKKMDSQTIVTEYWDYHPTFFDSSLFSSLYEDVSKTCKSYKVRAPFKGTIEYDSKRMSCYYTDKKKNIDAQSAYFGYDGLTSHDWCESSVLVSIKDIIEKRFDTYYDYCLVHIYRDGKDVINYHNDREAMTTDICSVSFGATRKFRFRKIGEKTGYETQLLLKSGDLLHMKDGCQKIYKHCVPQEKKVTEMRINLTFRKFE